MKSLKKIILLMMICIVGIGLVGCGSSKYEVKEGIDRNDLTLYYLIEFEDKIGKIENLKPILEELIVKINNNIKNKEIEGFGYITIKATDYEITISLIDSYIPSKFNPNRGDLFSYGYVEKDEVELTKETRKLELLLDELNKENRENGF